MSLREQFLLDPSIVFLNHGSFGACPGPVFEEYQRIQREMERNPVAFLGRRSAEFLHVSRQRLGLFLGARADDIVYVTNATTAVNTVARSLDLSPGDEVLTTDHEYGACDNVWRHVCQSAGASYVRRPVPLPLGDASSVAADFLAGITPRTRVIFLSHMTSSTALIFPVREIRAAARERGILTMVDGAHGPGHIALNLEDIGADFYTGNCHKWMCAPKGAAFLHARPEHHERLHGSVISWGYSDHISGHTGFDAYTGTSVLERRHQWQGTRDISAFLSVPAAIDFMEANGWVQKQEEWHRAALSCRDRICDLTGLSPIGSDDSFGQMVAVPIPPCDGDALKTRFFDEFNIEVPITDLNGQQFIRVSIAAYNTQADVDALVGALKKIFGKG